MVGMEPNPYTTPVRDPEVKLGRTWKRLLWFFGKPALALIGLLLVLRWINPFGAFSADSEPTVARMWSARLVICVYAGIGICSIGCLIALTGWRLTGYDD